MTHQQILDKLAAKHLAQSIDEDLAVLTYYAMLYSKGAELDYILPRLLLRWNCILQGGAEISDGYKQKTVLALAITLHKYGFADKTITASAVQAIDDLNIAVALSDDFFRKSADIKKFLTTTPVPLKRKPAMPENITFYRERDVVSIQLNKRFYAAYIHRLTGPNESPVIEFYDGVFEESPTLTALETLKAKGIRYGNEKEKISRYAISGMKFMPDLAGQIRLISACVDNKPATDHLEKPHGLYTMSDLFQIQEDIIQIFEE